MFEGVTWPMKSVSISPPHMNHISISRIKKGRCNYFSKNIDGSDLKDGVYGEDPRDAADTANWKVFTQKMGGVLSLRKEQVFKPYYELSVDRNTGVVKTSQYCDSELLIALRGYLQPDAKLSHVYFSGESIQAFTMVLTWSSVNKCILMCR